MGEGDDGLLTGENTNENNLLSQCMHLMFRYMECGIQRGHSRDVQRILGFWIDR